EDVPDWSGRRALRHRGHGHQHMPSVSGGPRPVRGDHRRSRAAAEAVPDRRLHRLPRPLALPWLCDRRVAPQDDRPGRPVMGRRARLRAAHGQRRILNTATVLDTVVGVHHTATVDKPWDAGANEKRLPTPVPVAKAKAVYAWYDSAQVADGALPKSACKFPHHEVNADGTVGAANLPACRNGLARLSGANVPDSDRDGTKRHLQA